MAFPILTPVVIAFGTAFVGNFFQNKDQKIKLEREHRQSTLAQASEIYTEASKTIDTLRYYMKEEAIYVAVRMAKGDTSREAQDKQNWQNYEAAMSTWKTNQNRLLSQVEVYYGTETATIMKTISERFTIGDRQIGATYYQTSNSLVNGTEADFDAFFRPLDFIEEEIKQLNVQMSRALQKGQVGNL